jgi:hypothetical protein
MRNIKKILLICFLASRIFFCDSAFANDLEYKIKAVLTLKIMSYIQWPDSAFDSSDSIFRVGVSGSEEVLAVFKSLEGKEINNRRIKVEQIKNLNELKSFNSIFISKHSYPEWKEILVHLNGSNTLTFGEMDSFTDSGGIINFYSLQGKIRFLINRKSAENADLKINAQLFRVGKAVGK